MAPGTCGAATATPTSAVRSPPGSGTGTLTGRGVLTPGPSTRTVTGVPLARIRPAPALASVTRMTCSGCATVPANRSVEVTLLIRMGFIVP